MSRCNGAKKGRGRRWDCVIWPWAGHGGGADEAKEEEAGRAGDWARALGEGLGRGAGAGRRRFDKKGSGLAMHCKMKWENNGSQHWQGGAIKFWRAAQLHGPFDSMRSA